MEYKGAAEELGIYKRGRQGASYNGDVDGFEDVVMKYDSFIRRLSEIIDPNRNKETEMLSGDVREINSLLWEIRKCFIFCNNNSIKGSLPFPLDVLFGIAKCCEYIQCLHSILSLFREYSFPDSFLQIIYESTENDSFLSLVLNEMNNSKNYENLEYEGEIAYFMSNIIRDQDDFIFFCEKGFLSFLFANLPRNYALHLIEKYTPYIPANFLCKCLEELLKHIHTPDEMSQGNILKCVLTVFKQPYEIEFHADGNFIQCLKDFLHPQNQELAANAMQIIIFIEPDEVFNTFINYVPYYETKIAAKYASDILIKFHSKLSSIMTALQMYSIMSALKSLDFNCRYLLFMGILEYINPGNNLDLDLLFLEQCSDFIEMPEIVGKVLTTALATFQFYFTKTEMKSHKNEFESYLSNITEIVLENDIVSASDEGINFIRFTDTYFNTD